MTGVRNRAKFVIKLDCSSQMQIRCSLEEIGSVTLIFHGTCEVPGLALMIS